MRQNVLPNLQLKPSAYTWNVLAKQKFSSCLNNELLYCNNCLLALKAALSCIFFLSIITNAGEIGLIRGSMRSVAKETA